MPEILILLLVILTGLVANTLAYFLKKALLSRSRLKPLKVQLKSKAGNKLVIEINKGMGSEEVAEVVKRLRDFAQQPPRRKASRSLMTLLLIAVWVIIGGGVIGGVIYETFSYLHRPVPSIPLASHYAFRYPLAGPYITLDPALARGDRNSITAIDMVFTGLVQLDDHLKVQPQLASSYSVSPDGVTWTFHLRPYLKFSDGTPLTSADVAYSIDRALQPAEKSTVGPIYLALIKDSDKLVAGKIKTVIGDSVLTPDPNTVELIANKKAAYFLVDLTFPTSYVVEKSVIDKWGVNWTDHLSDNGGQGGTGPFNVSQYKPGEEIDFVPNLNYYGPRPILQKVVFSLYRNISTTYQLYQTGKIDFAYLTPANLAQARTRPDFHHVPQLSIFYYTMNYLAKPFDNIHIRQAFAVAINKDEIVHTVWQDGLIPTNHIIPEGILAYNPELTGPDGTTSTEGDRGRAVQLFNMGLREEGWTDVSQLPPITLTYSSDGIPEVSNEVTMLVDSWRGALGVRVKTNDISFSKLLAEQSATVGNAKGLQFYEGLAIPAFGVDPQNWTTLQFGKNSPNNSMNYAQNNTSDAAQQQGTQQQLEQADTNLDTSARIELYRAAEQKLVNDVAWLPIEQDAANFLLKPYVQGIVPNALSLIPPNDWATIYISAH